LQIPTLKLHKKTPIINLGEEKPVTAYSSSNGIEKTLISEKKTTISIAHNSIEQQKKSIVKQRISETAETPHSAYILENERSEKLAFKPQMEQLRRGSAIKRRGAMAFAFAVLTWVSYLVVIATQFLGITTILTPLGLLGLITFLILTIIVGSPIRKRNDAAMWAIRLLWMLLIFALLVGITRTILGGVAALSF